VTRKELLGLLRRTERTLRSAAVQEFFEGQTDEQRARFVAGRQELSLLIDRLANAALADIAAKLDELAPDLRAGVDELAVALDRLAKPAAVLSSLASVLGLIARVAVVAS
jgi:hypothetical protein